MASREETLLFVVDVQVKNGRAIAALESELAALRASREGRLLALGDAATQAASGHRDLAAAIDEVNRRPVAGAGAAAAGVPNRGGPPSSDAALWGARGPRNPGGKVNPLVTTSESGASAGMGEMSADTVAAAAATAAAQAAANNAPSPTPAQPDKNWLAQAAQQVAQKVMAPEDDRIVQSIRAAAALRKNVGANPLLTAADAVQAAQVEPGMREAIQLVQAARGARTQPGPSLASLTAAQAAGRLGVPISKVRELAGTGKLAGASKSGGQWAIPEQAVLDMIGGGGGGGGPVLPPTGGAGDNGRRPFDSRRLLWGTGLFGLAGLGTVGSLAGFGPEHILMTALGLAGSATSAAGGAGMLGLGALGTMAVGAGSDILATKTAATNVKTLNTDLNNLSQAVALYGKNSQQAHQAQAQLNYDLKGMGAAAGPALKVATQLQNLDNLWAKVSVGAQKQADNIFTQVLQLASHYAPLVAQAAQQNLSVINKDLKPLFAWLNGPQGIQIFRDLEHQFAQNLPYAMGAFRNGTELLLRIMDIASQYTGGFVHHLDALFGRLNGMSNIQLGAEVKKLINDFRLWEAFVRAIGHDLHALFNNDAGTGNSIIASLTHMLVLLGNWETSVAGRQSLMTIFTVHRREIDQLLQVIPLLFRAFGPVYMTLAPALTGAFNEVAHAVLAVVQAIESIPGGTWLLGLTLLTAKVGLLARGLALLGLGPGAKGAAGKKVTEMTGGELAKVIGSGGAGAAAVEGAGGAAAGGAASGLLGKIAGTGIGTGISDTIKGLGLAGGLAASDAGFAGLATAITGAGAAVAPIAAGLIPLLAAAGGVYGLVQLFGLFASNSGPTTTLTSTQITRLLQQPGRGVLHQSATPGLSPTVSTFGRFGPAGTMANPDFNTLAQIGPTPQAKAALNSWLAIASNGSKLGQQSISGLQGLEREGQRLAQIFPKDAQLIDRYTKTIRSDLLPLQNMMATVVNRWKDDASHSLPSLVDIFNTNTRLIAHVAGLNSDQGRQAMAKNVAAMVSNLTRGMASGKIAVGAGMAELRKVLSAGAKDGAISWETETRDMFHTIEQLYARHKISTTAFLADLRTLSDHGFSVIASDTKQIERSKFAYLKQQENQGNITHATFLAKWHAAQQTANQVEAGDLAGFVGNLDIAMQQTGALTAKGMQVLAKEVNKALGLFGAAKLPIPDAIAWAKWAANGQAGTFGNTGGIGGGAGRATGGYVDRPMIVVGEEAPTHPEWVIASNPAYRPRNLGLWAEAGRALGVHGFAQGGMIHDPTVHGHGALTLLAQSAVDTAVKAANAYLGKHMATAGGSLGHGFPVHVSGSVAQWLRKAMSIVGVSGPAWLSMLERQVMRESGGNPGIINHWDINAQRGDPSEGLLQTTLSTFASYAVPGHHNILNPIDNSIAAIRYMIARYGHGSQAAALAYMIANGGNAYAHGGKVDFAGAFAGGGMFTANRPTMALFGENGAETAMFLPHYATGGKTNPLAQINKSLPLGITAVLNLLSGATPSMAAQIRHADRMLEGLHDDQHTLETDYRKALREHNKKLAKAIMGELDQVDKAIKATIATRTADLVQQIQNRAANLDTTAQGKGNVEAILQAIESLPKGTSLAALGLTPSLLASLGISGAGSLLGTAGTAGGTDALNKMLQQEIAAYKKELSYDERALPKLHGAAKSSMEQAIQQLIQTILGLQGDIVTNTQAVKGNTSATTNNTGAITGSVSYTLNGQNYLASDTPMSAGMV